MAFDIDFVGGYGNGGTPAAAVATNPFALSVGFAVVVAIVSAGPATVVSVVDTAGNTYSPIGAAQPMTGASDPAGGYVRLYAANNCIANGSNVVTVTLSAAQANNVIGVWTLDTDPRLRPAVLDTIRYKKATGSGIAVDPFNTGGDDCALFLVGWKSGANTALNPDSGYTNYFQTWGGYVTLSDRILSQQTDNLTPAFGIPGGGEAQMFVFALQADDLSAVVASHPGGNYGAAVNVALELDFDRPGIEIRYTTDGSDPDASDTLYTTPIAVSATTTLKARAIDPTGRLTPGPVMAKTYTFGTVNISGFSVDTVTGGDGSTLVASWTTNVPAYSFAYASDGVNTFPGAVNGYADIGTAHEVVIPGLTPGTQYSVTVESGGVVSAPVIATTRPAPPRGVATAGTMSFPTPVEGFGYGDIFSNFIDQNGICFVGRDDSADENEQLQSNLFIEKFPTPADEVSFAPETVNLLTNFGEATTSPLPTGYGGQMLTYKQTGLIIRGGKIYLIVSGQYYTGRQYCIFAFTIMSEDGGLTWNNCFEKTTFDPNGNVPPFRAFLWRDFTRGWVTPIIYAPDDGTLGHRVAGNAFDGGNAYDYFLRNDFFLNDDLMYLFRQPRALFAAQSDEGGEWWAGGTLTAETATAEFRDNANWSKDNLAATPIISDPGKLGGSYMGFLPGPNCYVFLTFSQTIPGNSTRTGWQLMTAPTPAGPFTVLDTADYPGDAFYGPAMRHRDLTFNEVANGVATIRYYATNDYNRFNQGLYRPCVGDLSLTVVTEGAGGDEGRPGVGSLFVGSKFMVSRVGRGLVGAGRN